MFTMFWQIVRVGNVASIKQRKTHNENNDSRLGGNGSLCGFAGCGVVYSLNKTKEKENK